SQNAHCVLHSFPTRRSSDLSGDEPDVLRVAALAVRDLLAELGLPSWVKTSGSKGYHIVAALDGQAGFDEVAAFARSVAEILVKRSEEHTSELQSRGHLVCRL